MKKYFLLLTISLLTFKVGRSQTNVSGGIYSNTTWTIVNSPYIVVDNVVVFPGVTLTIQPGVTVKFANSKRLEIRQSKLIALGTATDSITFTSNSTSPTVGIWSDIYFNQSNYSKFNYCNFYYADKGIYASYMYDTITIKNSNFRYNNIGLGWVYYSDVFVDSCIFKNNVNGIKWATGRINMSNSIISNNQNGILSPERSTYFRCIIDSNSVVGIATQQRDSIVECEIKYNGIGIDIGTSGSGAPSYITKNIIENNNLGIQLGYGYDQILCNRICNNTTYDLKSTINYNTNCVANNYWCTSDSASTEKVIYDGYDNISLGLVYFMPIDSACSPNTITSMNENKKIETLIFPNPFSNQTTLRTDNFLKDANLTVYNSFGQTVKQIKNISGQTVTFSRDILSSGLYFVRLTEENKIIAVDKLVITD